MMYAAGVPHPDGITFDRERDGSRLAKQHHRVKALMRDGQWRTLAQIASLLKIPEASASARRRDLRKEKFGAHTVDHRNCGGGLWEYRLTINPKEAEYAA